MSIFTCRNVPRFDTRSGHILSFLLPLIQEGQRKYVQKVLVNRLEGLSLPRKSVVRLTDRPDMTIDVYRGRFEQQHNMQKRLSTEKINSSKARYKQPLLVVYDRILGRQPV